MAASKVSWKPSFDAGRLVTPDSRLVIVSPGSKVVINNDSIPYLAHVEHLLQKDAEHKPLFIGELNGEACFSVFFPSEIADAVSVRAVLEQYPHSIAQAVTRATQIAEWDATCRFCGNCGHQTRAVDLEPARTCPNCQRVDYPKIVPAVIMLVTHGNTALLARRVRSSTHWGALAGFVETGENAEEAVVREVAEEVGLTVDEITYVASQVWPFPSQLMLGFIAEVTDTKIKLNKSELASAKWFVRDGKLPLLPRPFTLARQLVDTFFASAGDPAAASIPLAVVQQPPA